MAFTNVARIKALIQSSDRGFHATLSDTAMAQAADSANAYLKKMGVSPTETDEGLRGAADRLALSYLLDGLIAQQALRGKSQATGSLRLLAEQMRNSAMETAGSYVVYATRRNKAARNLNWAPNRGGPLRRGSEAGRFGRSTR